MCIFTSVEQENVSFDVHCHEKIIDAFENKLKTGYYHYADTPLKSKSVPPLISGDAVQKYVSMPCRDVMRKGFINASDETSTVFFNLFGILYWPYRESAT